MSGVLLRGLGTQPLSSYLAALGVLRLLSEQRDSSVCGYWECGSFCLQSELTAEEIVQFFLTDYSPSAITSPWNGGSGYYAKDNKSGIGPIDDSGDERFCDYRETLATVREVLTELEIESKPSGALKIKLLRTLHTRLSGPALKWLNAVVIWGKPIRYAPLLGTGGNDGRLEFSNNFMQRVTELFLTENDTAEELLEAALFGVLGRHCVEEPVGQFDPGAAGGVNLDTGFEADGVMNPWYYIFMMEGALMFPASASPFSVRHVGAGNGKLGSSEKNRGELWLPEWREPKSCEELSELFARPPERMLSAVEFAAAPGRSDGFHRYAFLQRNGKAYFATHLGYYPPDQRPGAKCVLEMEDYLRLHRDVFEAAGVVRRYDDAVFEYLRTGESFGRVLECLGALHRYLVESEELCEKLPPLPSLSPQWAELGCDDSAEFFLAYALSTLGNGKASRRYNLRTQLSPYWEVAGRRRCWVGGDLCERLVNLLLHRIRRADRPDLKGDVDRYNYPLMSELEASRAHLEAFLNGDVDERRLEELFFGLVLLRHHHPKLRPTREAAFLGVPFVVCKLAYHPGEGDSRVPPSSMVRDLVSGKVDGALETARRFLVRRGLHLSDELTGHQPRDPRRLAAALVFPINDRTYQELKCEVSNE